MIFCLELLDYIHFSRGDCWRGDACRFSHKSQGNERKYPICRNGPWCKYLSSGICSFFHHGVGVQKPRSQESAHQSQERRQFCRFTEDCRRVPNCPYLHSEQDFPKLPKKNCPPIGARRIIQAWAEY